MFSFFGAMLDCYDCKGHAELRSNDIRDLIVQFKASGWSGMDVTVNDGHEYTVFLCKACTQKSHAGPREKQTVRLELVGGGKRR
jgi:hypothetical protein